MRPAGEARGTAGHLAGRAGPASAWAAWAASAAAVVAILGVVGTAAALGGVDPGAAAERSLPMWLVALGLAGPVAAAGAAWAVRAEHPSVTWGLTVATAATAVPAWSGWASLPDAVRAGALAVVPLAVAGTAQVALGWFSGSGEGGILRALYALAAAAVVLHLGGYDPLADLTCARTCADVDPFLSSVLTTRLVVLLAGGLMAVGILLAGAAVLRARRSPPPVRAGVLLSLGALALGVLVRSTSLGGADVQGATLVILPAAVLPLALSVAVVAARRARVRAAVAGVIDQLGSPPRAAGGSTRFLSSVHFAVDPDGRRWVDAEGSEVPAGPPMGAVVLDDPSGPAIRLIPAARVRGDAVVAGLTPARRLALENARLDAVARAHLTELRSSRRRVVARADAERRRIERDLHDGVQQRLVGASLHLSAARGRTSAAATALLESADAALSRSMAQLRRITRGVFPEGLLDEGLEVALDELARDSDREVDLRTSGNLSVDPDVTMAAYASVRAALGTPAAGAVAVRVAVRGGRLTVHADLTGLPDGEWREGMRLAADRVGAAGGTLDVRATNGATTMTVVIPCGS